MVEVLDHSWGEGYVIDTGYTHGFYPELAPNRLHFVALLRGVSASCAVNEKFTYIELGCGNGLSTTLLASANPQ